MTRSHSLPLPHAVPAANDRLKSSFGAWFWGGMIAATLFHFALLALWPTMETGDYKIDTTLMEQVEVMQQFEIPPPPEQIARPAVPVLSTDVNISEDITIGAVTFEDNPVSDLPPPPIGKGVDVSEQPTFTPYEVKPEIRNRSELERLLARNYPPTLRDAGIGGKVVLWVFIDEAGGVQKTQVTQSSGYEQLDEAARRVMQGVKFSPALNRDQKVPVWVQLPVQFESQ